MSGDLGVMVLLHYPLLQLWVVGDIQEILVIKEPILELSFSAADRVYLGVLECFDHNSNKVLPGLLLSFCPNLL